MSSKPHLHVVSNDDDDVTNPDISEPSYQPETQPETSPAGGRARPRVGRGGVPVPPPGRGRKLGQHNKHTRILKEAILIAAEQVGENDRGRGGLVGYLRRIARNEPRAFAMLLQKVIPTQVSGRIDFDVALREEYTSVKEAREKLRQLGVPVLKLYQAAEDVEQLEDHSDESPRADRETE
jgi:hypothetical protein